jgi:hypothetical protein
MPIVAAAVAYYILPVLSGARGLWAVAIPPICAGVGAGSAWPVWVALNSDASQTQADIAALVTLVLGCCTVWFATFLVSSRRAQDI